MEKFRIHGDNIVECERIIKYILSEIKPSSINKFLTSPSTLTYEMMFDYENTKYNWTFDLLPGFNKAGRSRWKENIFRPLKENGSFLDETPDAIISRINGNEEEIVMAIEFCSALQAGNQAWQRSGRAFSTGRTGCPYVYIVDFVKYELDSKTRDRKALRFPNPIVPFSYVSFSNKINNFVCQVYVKAEEFDKTADSNLAGFDESDFGDKELSKYIVYKLANKYADIFEKKLIEKNMNVVSFLSNSSSDSSFYKKDWEILQKTGQNIIDYSVKNANFNFHKIITQKGHHGFSASLQNIIDKYSKGLSSRDLPFGIIPKDNRKQFVDEVKKLYKTQISKDDIFEKLGNDDKHLIICMMKGFKPRGDDNRPDRGLLPLISMISNNNNDVLTFIYGPLLRANYTKLVNHSDKLAEDNGLWNTIISLSDYLLLDVPLIPNSKKDPNDIADLIDLGNHKISEVKDYKKIEMKTFSSVPTSFHEDDVDTGIHYLFTQILKESCFEGMCNPPGGDWSGLSIVDNDVEKRWLSLPRVSDAVDGKRPDHVIEIFGIDEKPVLLSIESKEKSSDLEINVGIKLINYLTNLFDYIPNVEKNRTANNWKKSKNKVNGNNFKMISAAAYLKETAQSSSTVYSNSQCEMLFIMDPTIKGWKIEIITFTSDAKTVKDYIIKNLKSSKEIVVV